MKTNAISYLASLLSILK